MEYYQRRHGDGDDYDSSDTKFSTLRLFLLR